jgi:hypothetical protein
VFVHLQDTQFILVFEAVFASKTFLKGMEWGKGAIARRL